VVLLSCTAAQSRIRLVALATAIVLSLASLSVFPSASSAADRVDLQAEFIAKFPRYVEWPEDRFASADDPIVVGILGPNPYGDALAAALDGATAHGRSFEIRTLVDIEEAKATHILIVGEKDRSKLREIAHSLKGLPVVTIAPTFRFSKAGGIVGMEMYKKKVAFEINNKSAKKANLKIRSRVLQLATNVY